MDISNEQAVVEDLVSRWVSLASEFAGDAPEVSAFYIYVSSERGSIYPEVLFEQRGSIVYPKDLEGTDTSIDRIRAVHRFQSEDLQAAEKQFDAAGVPRLTEYRIYFEPATRKLDAKLSRDLIYANSAEKIPEHGVHEWLGDRAPKLF